MDNVPQLHIHEYCLHYTWIIFSSLLILLIKLDLNQEMQKLDCVSTCQQDFMRIIYAIRKSCQNCVHGVQLTSAS